MTSPGPDVGVRLRAQGQGRKTVAEMRGEGESRVSIHTAGFPELDGAPGRTFPKAPLLDDAADFGMAAVPAKIVNNGPTEPVHNTSAFVPTISAVASADIDDHTAGHTVKTRERGQWIVADCAGG